MIRPLRVLLLRMRAFWLRIQVEIDEGAIQAHTPSLERNRLLLAQTEFEIDTLLSSRSIISNAMRRAGK